MDPKWLSIAVLAAVEAGGEILQIYEGEDFQIEHKTDQSPLTKADRASHRVITAALAPTNLPILSEEGRQMPYGDRAGWSRFWMVDPLDGTKEFIKRNGEFTVNIALVEKDRPVMGVILVPVSGVLYFAARDLGAYRLDHFRRLDVNRMQAAQKPAPYLAETATRLPIKKPGHSPYTIVGSRSHATPELEQFVEEKRRQYEQVEFVSAGSSLKICLVAEGAADIYPRLGPTMEWDTAAGHVIAECAGAVVRQHGGDQSLIYNKENLLNPWFVVSRKGSGNRSQSQA
jgi:3'(2'), 5'-bisphosphate nucleotidase